ncbi:MAG: ferritin-like domain-containing protein, partial [Actinomycetota bacterium]|nr:ferritin-like domain-containing protein [Actinomycetota bacterium]
MAKLKEPRELFSLKLSKAYAAQRETLEILEEVQKEVHDEELKRLWEHHAGETQRQIKNLDQAFQALGEKPQETKARVVEGVRGDHDEFMRQGAEPFLVDAFLAGAAAHIEHHEISAYEGLITMAQAMGEDDIVGLLQENLEQEQHTL